MWNKIIKENKNGVDFSIDRKMVGNPILGGWMGFQDSAFSLASSEHAQQALPIKGLWIPYHKRRSPYHNLPNKLGMQNLWHQIYTEFDPQKDPWNSWLCSCRDLFTFR